MLWQWWTIRNKKNAGEGSRTIKEVAFQSRRWPLEFSEFYVKKQVPEQQTKPEKSGGHQEREI
jgi:hypothetical protein